MTFKKNSYGMAPDPISPQRAAIILATIRWVREEMRELELAVTTTQQNDAILDAMGVLLCAVDSLERREPGVTVRSYEYYETAQILRGRDLFVPHHHAMRAALGTLLDGVRNPRYVGKSEVILTSKKFKTE